VEFFENSTSYLVPPPELNNGYVIGSYWLFGQPVSRCVATGIKYPLALLPFDPLKMGLKPFFINALLICILFKKKNHNK
jgi:hypothetical protein